MQRAVTLTKREVARFKASVDALAAMVDSFLMNGDSVEVPAKVVKRRKRVRATQPPTGPVHIVAGHGDGV